MCYRAENLQDAAIEGKVDGETAAFVDVFERERTTDGGEHRVDDEASFYCNNN